MSKSRPYIMVGASAAGIEIGAAFLALGVDTVAMLIAAGVLHLGAARLAVWAARLRRPDLGQVDADLVFFTALLVPIFGPAKAWTMPHANAQEKIEDAHQVFERYADHVKPAAPDYERTLFTGDYEKDLARELDAESYHEVLRHGCTDQKRNALARLADLGEPKHFRMVRRCLRDKEHEVRLYAYNELERSGRVFEEKIARCSKAKDGDPEAEAERQLSLAQAYFDYARSGIHDEEMAAFYFRSAERFAATIASSEGVWLRAGSLARLGEYDEADKALEALPEAEAALAQSCIARADVAYRRRNFAAARAETRRIVQAGAEPPEWLTALGAAGAQKSGETS